MIIKKQKVKKKFGGGGGKILRTLNLKNAFIDFFFGNVAKVKTTV